MQANSTFVGAVNLLATMLSFIASFLLTPIVYEKTVYWIIDYTGQSYGYGFEGLVSFVWGIFIAITIFAFSRATIATALVLGGLTLASRLF